MQTTPGARYAPRRTADPPGTIRTPSSADSFRGDGSYSAWLFRIAHNSLSSWRQRAARSDVVTEDVPDEILDRTEKTFATEYFWDQCVDYPSLRRWLLTPEYRMPGVDYARLAEELERESMPLNHYLWARDLAVVHAFLDLWS
jgi:DNA-directed RNA polymerase specialized sigma24 family protein